LPVSELFKSINLFLFQRFCFPSHPPPYTLSHPPRAFPDSLDLPTFHIVASRRSAHAGLRAGYQPTLSVGITARDHVSAGHGTHRRSSIDGGREVVR
jgi:hypothetical protein